jgi:hypothetical protein
MTSRVTRHRIAAAGGLGYFLLTLIGIALSPIVDLGANTRDIQAYFASVSPERAVLSVYLVCLASVWLLAFVLHISNNDSVGARAGHILTGVGVSILTLTACCVSAAVVAGPIAQPLLPLASAASWAAQVPFAITGLSLAASGRLPTWLAAIGGIIAAGVIVSVPFAAQSPIVHVPATLLGLWYATTSIRTLRLPQRTVTAANTHA